MGSWRKEEIKVGVFSRSFEHHLVVSEGVVWCGCFRSCMLEDRLESEAVVYLFCFIASPVIKVNGVS